MRKVLVISKVHTHPTNMGNCWGILAQTKILQDLGCHLDFLYVQERGLSKNCQDRFDTQFEQTKNYWGNNFIFFKVGKFEKFAKNLLSKYRQYCCSYHEGTYDKYPLGLTQFVKKLQQQNKYDICIVNYYYLTKLFNTVEFPKMACFTHDALAYKNLTVGEQCLWIDANQEARALQLCSDVFAVQDGECEYFHILSPMSRVYNIYSKYAYTPMAIVGNKNILFLSGDNSFNQNGLRWFVKDILPLIRAKYKDAKLIVAGGICKVLKDKYNNVDGVELIGYVDDPKELYAKGDIAINPVYQGTGLKIKTFEAISYDKVTLVHPHSMVGVFKKETAPLFASDKPEEWVKYLETIWSDQEKILDIKNRNKQYLGEMNEFIINEYKRFLEI